LPAEIVFVAYWDVPRAILPRSTAGKAYVAVVGLLVNNFSRVSALISILLGFSAAA
jgi:hypothetical protein